MLKNELIDDKYILIVRINKFLEKEITLKSIIYQ